MNIITHFATFVETPGSETRNSSTSLSECDPSGSSVGAPHRSFVVARIAISCLERFFARPEGLKMRSIVRRLTAKASFQDGKRLLSSPKVL